MSFFENVYGWRTHFRAKTAILTRFLAVVICVSFAFPPAFARPHWFYEGAASSSGGGGSRGGGGGGGGGGNCPGGVCHVSAAPASSSRPSDTHTGKPGPVRNTGNSGNVCTGPNCPAPSAPSRPSPSDTHTGRPGPVHNTGNSSNVCTGPNCPAPSAPSRPSDTHVGKPTPIRIVAPPLTQVPSNNRGFVCVGPTCPVPSAPAVPASHVPTRQDRPTAGHSNPTSADQHPVVQAGRAFFAGIESTPTVQAIQHTVQTLAQPTQSPLLSTADRPTSGAAGYALTTTPPSDPTTTAALASAGLLSGTTTEKGWAASFCGSGPSKHTHLLGEPALVVGASGNLIGQTLYQSVQALLPVAPSPLLGTAGRPTPGFGQGVLRQTTPGFPTLPVSAPLSTPLLLSPSLSIPTASSDTTPGAAALSAGRPTKPLYERGGPPEEAPENRLMAGLKGILLPAQPFLPTLVQGAQALYERVAATTTTTTTPAMDALATLGSQLTQALQSAVPTTTTTTSTTTTTRTADQAPTGFFSRPPATPAEAPARGSSNPLSAWADRTKNTLQESGNTLLSLVPAPAVQQMRAFVSDIAQPFQSVGTSTSQSSTRPAPPASAGTTTTRTAAPMPSTPGQDSGAPGGGQSFQHVRFTEQPRGGVVGRLFEGGPVTAMDRLQEMGAQVTHYLRRELPQDAARVGAALQQHQQNAAPARTQASQGGSISPEEAAKIAKLQARLEALRARQNSAPTAAPVTTAVITPAATTTRTAMDTLTTLAANITQALQSTATSSTTSTMPAAPTHHAPPKPPVSSSTSAPHRDAQPADEPGPTTSRPSAPPTFDQPAFEAQVQSLVEHHFPGGAGGALTPRTRARAVQAAQTQYLSAQVAQQEGRSPGVDLPPLVVQHVAEGLQQKALQRGDLSAAQTYADMASDAENTVYSQLGRDNKKREMVGQWMGYAVLPNAGLSAAGTAGLILTGGLEGRMTAEQVVEEAGLLALSAAVPLANVGMAGTGIGPVGRTLAAEKPALQALGREFQALGREVLGLENPLPAGVGRGNLRVRPENLPGAGRGAAGPKTRATEPTTRGETSAPTRSKNSVKAKSKVWKDLKPFRGKYKQNQEGTEVCKWDYTHNDIEVFDPDGRHLGSRDPATGEMYKGPVPGRREKGIK